MRTTLDIESDLLEKLRSEARQRGVSLKEALNRAIRAGLAGPRGELPPYECPSFSMGRPDPSLDLDKALEIAARLEDEETAREMDRRK
jgi:hypothetical protein